MLYNCFSYFRCHDIIAFNTQSYFIVSICYTHWRAWPISWWSISFETEINFNFQFTKSLLKIRGLLQKSLSERQNLCHKCTIFASTHIFYLDIYIFFNICIHVEQDINNAVRCSLTFMVIHSIHVVLST